MFGGPRKKTRCRNYDMQTGAPINGGCNRGRSCNFVHPDHPDWASAQESRGWNHRSGGGSGFPGASANAQGLGKRSGNWDPPTAPRKRQSFDHQAGGSSGDGGWGYTGDNEDINPWAGGCTSSWGAPPDDVGWGAASTGVDWSSGWGAVTDSKTTADKDKDKDKDKADKASGWSSATWGEPSGTKKDEKALVSSSGDDWNSSSSWGVAATSGQTGCQTGDWSSNVLKSGSPPRLSQNIEVDSAPTEVPSLTSEAPEVHIVATEPKAKTLTTPLFDQAGDKSLGRDVSQLDANQLREQFQLFGARPSSPSENSEDMVEDIVIEGRSVWKSYIQKIARVVRYYEKLRAVEKQRSISHNMKNSKCYRGLDEGSAAHRILSEVREEDERRYRAAKQQFQDALETLIELEFPTINAGLGEDDQAKAEEVQGYLKETSEWIESIRPLVQKLKQEKSASPSITEPPPPDIRKRRRSSVSISEDNLAKVREMIAHLENRVDDLEEYFHSAILDHQKAEFDTRKSEQVKSATSMLRSAEDEAGEAHRAFVGVEEDFRLRMDTFAANNEDLQARLTAVSNDFKGFPEMLSQVHQEQYALIQEREKLRQAISENRTGYSELQSMVVSQDSQIASLRERLDSIEKQPPSPPLPTPQFIVDALKPLIIDSCKPDVQEALKGIHTNIEEKMKQQQSMLVRELWKGMLPVLRVTESLQRFVEDENRIVQSATQPPTTPRTGLAAVVPPTPAS